MRDNVRARWTAVVVLVVGLGVVAPSLFGSATGHVTGTLEMVGGPASGHALRVPGTVTFVSAGHERTVPAAENGAFSVDLPAGTYDVRGTSPRYGSGAGVCTSPQSVHVGAGQSTHVEVNCQMM